MNLPADYKTKKYLLYELIAAAIVLILLIIRLSRSYISFHWVSDTIWILSALLLVIPALTTEKPLMKYPDWLRASPTPFLLGLYLFLYHFFLAIFRIKNINLEWMLIAAAAILFVMALYLRAWEKGFRLQSFDWKNGLKYPYWPMTIGLGLCMLAPFFKMTRFYSLQSTYGLQFNYSANYGWGYNNWGYNYYTVRIAIKGYYAYWGHLACILIAFMLILHWLQAAGKISHPKTTYFFKLAVPALFAWWLLGAKGYQALKSFGNILFIPGILITALAIYFPNQVDAWTKKKNLIS